MFLVHVYYEEPMPRPPKPERLRNPLRQLRELFGTDEPISQPELSRLIGVPANTIKAIEAGARPLSRQLEKKIEVLTGANWDSKKKRWIFRSLQWRDGHSHSEIDPCTAAQLRAYQDMLKETGAVAPDRDRDAVKMRIDALFDQIPERYWMQLLLTMQNFLNDIREKFAKEFKDGQEVARTFHATSSTGLAFTDPQTGKIHGQRSYAFDHDAMQAIMYRKRMAEHYTKLSKHVRADLSWVQKFGA